VVFIFSVNYGFINSESEGVWVSYFQFVINFLTGVPLLIFEVLVLLYFLFFSYYSNSNWLYKVSKWMLIKCFLGLTVVPLFYSVAMLEVTFINFSILAITNVFFGYLFAFLVALLLPDQSVNSKNNVRGENK
jgi:hypothetical protein